MIKSKLQIAKNMWLETRKYLFPKKSVISRKLIANVELNISKPKVSMVHKKANGDVVESRTI
jgi:hypothetical protein